MPLPRLALVGAAITSHLAAQSVTPAATGDTVKLNPYVISAETDNGYAPTETLSGTRLKTAAKDIPPAISIISADMLADLGALNFNDVLDFLPSTARYQNNEGDVDNNGQRTGNPYTVRGFRSDSLTTNFFTELTPIDSYNTSRFTFTRGPN
jgi:outer membrane receptor protein involved in Fe transport